jgi:simple sugar transport system ATP-binding protein
MHLPPPVPLIALRAVSKRYTNGKLANDTLSFSVQANTIHAILGENGAGKSTVLKMLYGLEQPSEGEILLNGKAVQFRHPREAMRARIGLVPQHLKLVPSFTVAQNIALGGEPLHYGLIDHAAMRAAVRNLADGLGMAVDPDAVVAGLSAGEQQRVEILKALYRGADILLLDEPTALLTPQEARALFATLRRMVGDGMTIILITHKLDEVISVSDRFTVLRAGKVSGEGDARAVSAAELTGMIVGQAPSAALPARRAAPAAAPLVCVRALGGAGLHNLDFEIGAGEILGIAGVEGNGQAPLAAMLAGLRAPASGAATIDGQVFTGLGVRAARAVRVGAIPEDRLHDGAAVHMSIIDNLIALGYRCAPLARRGWLAADAARALAERLIAAFGVSAHSPDMPIGELSGGNIQKLVLARELSAAPRFLIASQPTRGVDIGAAQALREHLLRLRDAGAAILLLSADLDELIGLSDRVAVLANGRLVAHFDAATVTPFDLGAWMTGAAAAPVQARLGAPMTLPALEGA